MTVNSNNKLPFRTKMFEFELTILIHIFIILLICILKNIYIVI